MADQHDQDVVYVIPVAQVRECIEVLLSRNTHPYFVAYLHLRSIAGRTGSLTGLRPRWAELGSFLEVPGAPPGKPHLRPFWSGERKAGQEWLNQNLAGSFAPSSLREGQPPTKVVETDAKGRYLLRPEHWKLARKHLLFGERLPAAAVAGFILRDYGFIPDQADTPQDASDAISAFRSEFAYSANDDEEFNYLFDIGWSGSGPWFEKLPSREDTNKQP